MMIGIYVVNKPEKITIPAITYPLLKVKNTYSFSYPDLF